MGLYVDLPLTGHCHNSNFWCSAQTASHAFHGIPTKWYIVFFLDLFQDKFMGYQPLLGLVLARFLFLFDKEERFPSFDMYYVHIKTETPYRGSPAEGSQLGES